MRKYRILENILLHLGLSWDAIYHASNELVIPQEIHDKLESKLTKDFVMKCPHGSVIPSLQQLDVIKPSYPLSLIPGNSYVGSFIALEQSITINGEKKYSWDYMDTIGELSKMQKPCHLKIDEDGRIILSSSTKQVTVPKTCEPLIYVYESSNSPSAMSKESTIQIIPNVYTIQKAPQSQTREKLSDLISQTSENLGIYTFNKNLELTSWNSEMEKITNLKKNETIGKILINLFPTILNETHINSVIDVFMGKVSTVEEFQIKEKLYKVYLYPLKNMAGDIIGGTAVIK